MKKFLMILGSVLILIGSAGFASAVPTTWVDFIDWSPDESISDALWYGELCDGFSYYHNIADDGFSSAWMGGDDTISSISLSLSLYDDEDRRREGADIIIAADLFNIQHYDFSQSFNTFGTITGRIDLLHDGTLNVYIEPTQGDFFADWSRLTVDGDNGDMAPVPEPATMILMGLGLVGLAGASRKKLLKK